MSSSEPAAETVHDRGATAARVVRINATVLRAVERRVLAWLAVRLPRSISPDMLTVSGLFGAILSCAGFALMNWGRAWALLAAFGIVVNWFGDSLDGTVARMRGIERPQYGFFLDHTVDAVVMALITAGMAFSPLMRIGPSVIVLAAYYMLTVLTLVTCVATGVFRVSYNGIGPTEVRLFIICGVIAGWMLPVPAFPLLGEGYSVYDGGALVIAALMVLTGAAQAVATGRHLAETDPP